MKYKVRVISSRGKRYVQVIDGSTRRVKKSFGRDELENIARACQYCSALNGLIQFFEKSGDEEEEEVKILTFVYFGGVLSAKDMGDEYDESRGDEDV